MSFRRPRKPNPPNRNCKRPRTESDKPDYPLSMEHSYFDSSKSAKSSRIGSVIDYSFKGASNKDVYQRSTTSEGNAQTSTDETENTAHKENQNNQTKNLISDCGTADNADYWWTARGFAIPKDGPAFISPSPIVDLSQNQVAEFVLELLPADGRVQNTYHLWDDLTKSEKSVVRSNFLVRVNAMNNYSYYKYNNTYINWEPTRNNFYQTQEQQDRAKNYRRVFFGMMNAFNVWSLTQRYRGACGNSQQNSPNQFSIYESQMRIDSRDEIYQVSDVLMQCITQYHSKTISNNDDDWN